MNNFYKERAQLLEQSDWVVVRSIETGTPIPEVWVKYRQALRDITKQPGFPESYRWPPKMINDGRFTEEEYISQYEKFIF